MRLQTMSLSQSKPVAAPAAAPAPVRHEVKLMALNEEALKEAQKKYKQLREDNLSSENWPLDLAKRLNLQVNQIYLMVLTNSGFV